MSDASRVVFIRTGWMVWYDYVKEPTTLQGLPSLDRIDSDGHYEIGNLQLVCRFANFWKGASENEEFRPLLAIVRGMRSSGCPPEDLLTADVSGRNPDSLRERFVQPLVEALGVTHQIR